MLHQKFRLSVQTMEGERMTFEVTESTLVKEVKERVTDESGIPVGSQNLYFNLEVDPDAGKEGALRSHNTLGECGIKGGSPEQTPVNLYLVVFNNEVLHGLQQITERCNGRTPSLNVKVLLVGETRVGKSAFIKHLVDKKMPKKELKQTIGIDFRRLHLNLDSAAMLGHPEAGIIPFHTTVFLWDTAGEPRFRSLNQSFFRGAACTVLMFSLQDRSSFEALADHKAQSEAVTDDAPPTKAGSTGPFDPPPFIVIGNDFTRKRKVPATASDDGAPCPARCVTEQVTKIE